MPALLLLLLLLSVLDAPAKAADVDVAIVFAVDVSASVDRDTARLQREGHATAISEPAVIAAIARGPTGCIAVAYVEWASRGRAKLVLPWTRICHLEEARAVATVIRSSASDGGNCYPYCATSISDAIDFSSNLLGTFDGVALGRIIDISSNGRNNDGEPVSPSRDRALARGYTINAIVLPEMRYGVPYHLTDYFRDEVIGGEGAFVVEPETANDYVSALRRKLVGEISLSVDRQTTAAIAVRLKSD